MKSEIKYVQETTLTILQNVNPYLHAATSENTRKAYQQDIRHFMVWGGLLPTTPEIILQYLQHYAEKLNPQTLKRRIIAIRHWHTYQGFNDPTSHPLIIKMLSGISRLHGTPPTKAPTLSVEQLIKIANYLSAQGSLAAYRDNALLQIGFFGAFRRSELAALKWEDINFVAEGLVILIPRSKTDQEGKGLICAIPYGNKVLCPVGALQQWRKRSNITMGPVFNRISKNSQQKSSALSPVSINWIIKKYAQVCELPDAKSYSGHSLRRGFATAASRKGASFSAIMRHGRWRHEGTVHGYIEEGQQFKDNAVNSILKG